MRSQQAYERNGLAMANDESILNSVKKSLGIEASYTVFDPDIIMHINSTFAVLHQLGVGPDIQFQIEDDSAVWEDFLSGRNELAMVKSYVFLKTRMLFDPPQGSVLDIFKEQAAEYEWRMNVEVETPAVSNE